MIFPVKPAKAKRDRFMNGRNRQAGRRFFKTPRFKTEQGERPGIHPSLIDYLFIGPQTVNVFTMILFFDFAKRNTGCTFLYCRCYSEKRKKAEKDSGTQKEPRNRNSISVDGV